MNKKWYESKTIWGIILTALQLILKQKGIEIPIIGADTGALLTGGLTAYGLRDAISTNAPSKEG